MTDSALPCGCRGAHRPGCLKSFAGLVAYCFNRWYAAAKPRKVLPLNTRDAFVGGFVSGLDAAIALAIEEGQEGLALKLSALPEQK